MDISRYAVNAESIDALSTYQIDSLFRRHKSITKDDLNRTAASIIGSPVSPTLVQGAGNVTSSSGHSGVADRIVLRSDQVVKHKRKVAAVKWERKQ
ncbi:hypothetical protein BKA61DRAFT_605359 [Leptodontidium sp. MPI-SDFR-AT-0119]|nr:hypothetical protein BKA61DRAFT_605359 [Leptodontidium sp. MPI-SDFR-AT-0119]